ncbi:EpsG family protein [Alkalilimnicola ehrlichii]|uniref:EpsG family protein n=1 Tax=Alkalilimnicola ehrlichii TaxID=351052 RepID=UPI0015F29008|nr:EpsG family protein [Alkalilimnicola ehrlichii]
MHRRYLFAVALAVIAPLFHFTAVLFWPAFLFARYIRCDLVLAAGVVVAFFLYLKPSYVVQLVDLLSFLKAYLPGYERYFSLVQREAAGVGVRALFECLIALAGLFLINRREDIALSNKVIVYLFVIGVVLRFALVNFADVSRLANYFIVFQGVVVALLVSRLRTRLERLIAYIAAVFVYMAMLIKMLLDDPYSVVPYSFVVF